MTALLVGSARVLCRFARNAVGPIARCAIGGERAGRGIDRTKLAAESEASSRPVVEHQLSTTVICTAASLFQLPSLLEDGPNILPVFDSRVPHSRLVFV
jgi:hypothetical protein